MQFGELLDHRQAETGAFEFTRQATIDLTEGLEQFRHVCLGNAEAAVADAYFEKFVVLIVGQGKSMHWPGARKRANRVARNPSRAQAHTVTVGAEFDCV